MTGRFAKVTSSFLVPLLAGCVCATQTTTYDLVLLLLLWCGWRSLTHSLTHTAVHIAVTTCTALGQQGIKTWCWRATLPKVPAGES